jgi:hypothetical protein
VGSSYSGVLSCDHFTAYKGYGVTAQQKCQAHLPPNFKTLIKIPGFNHQEIGTKFMDLIDEGFQNYPLFPQTQNLHEFLTWPS